MICVSGHRPGFLHGFAAAQLSREPQVFRFFQLVTLTRRLAAPSPDGRGRREAAGEGRVKESSFMNLTKITTSILLVVTLALPAMASSDWVDDFLRRYDPRTVAPRPESGGGTNIGQFL